MIGRGPNLSSSERTERWAGRRAEPSCAGGG